ncbi:MAG: LapA family protein [Bacteroidales bacterium]
MQKTFIGMLLIIVAVVFFALKNAQHVYVDFWLWIFDSNLSLVIVLAVTFGALSSFLLSLPYRARKNKEIKERDKRIKFLDNEITHLYTKVEKTDEDKTYKE